MSEPPRPRDPNAETRPYPSPPPARTSPPAESITGAASLIRSLEAAGVDTVFGIPGGAILPAYDPLMDSTKIRHVLVRHEQGAGHAAEGYALATGKVGVCMATSGPGATNLVTAIADAHMDSIPMAALATWPVIATIGTESRRAVPIPVTRLVAPGPEVPMHTPTLPVTRA